MVRFLRGETMPKNAWREIQLRQAWRDNLGRKSEVARITIWSHKGVCFSGTNSFVSLMLVAYKC